MEVNHRDADKCNPRLANLEYVTRSQNLLHRTSLGIGRGENHPGAKLDDETVRRIRLRRADGLGYLRLSREFRTPKWTIRAITNGKLWRHVV